MVRIDNARERRPVSLWADVGGFGPDELVGRHALARLGHAGQAQVGTVGQDCREERVLVIVWLVRAQVGEGLEEARFPCDLVQQLGDAHARHQTFNPRLKVFSRRRRVGAHRRDRELSALEGDAVHLAARQTVREAFQQPVEFAAAIG